MAVVAGSVFSALCFEHSHASADSEGFLLGHFFKHVKSVISDSQINNTKEQAVIYVNGYVPLNGVCNWYDSTGTIDQKKIRAILEKENCQAVVGWYRSRRHSSMRPSLREKALHTTLPYALQNIPPDKFIFGLFTTTETSNLATHCFEHQFLQHDGRAFKPLQISIANLGNTSHDEYREHPNMSLDPGASNYFTDALESYRSDFFDSKSSTLKQVFNLDNLDSQLQSKLMDMSQEVAQSEEELEELQRIVDNMELQCSQIAKPLAPLKEFVPMQVDDDPFGKAPLNKGLNKKRLSSPKPNGPPAHQNVQVPSATRIDSNAIHEDLLCLSMDTSPPQIQTSETKVYNKNEGSDMKNALPHPVPSTRSPQLSVRSSKQKVTSAEIEVMDTNPILEPQKSATDTQRPTTCDNVQTSNPKAADTGEPFGFVTDLMKTTTPPKATAGKSVKLKMSKSADTGLSNGQTKVSVKSSSKDPFQNTEKTQKKPVTPDVDTEGGPEDQKEYTLSSSPAF